MPRIVLRFATTSTAVLRSSTRAVVSDGRGSHNPRGAPLRSNSSRIARMLESAKADAWVAYSAPRPVLEWFVSRSLPVMAVGGGFAGLPVASTAALIDDAIRHSVRSLHALGHRRIVAISPDSWRIPLPSQTGRAYLAALEECGHSPTSYHLPAWDQTPEGLEKLLESLFLLTPPTALIFVNPAPYVTGGGGRLGPQDLVSFREWKRTTAGMARAGATNAAEGYGRL